MRYFPIFLDLKGRHIVVVGGGEEATRKVRLLLKTDAEIAVVAPELHPELAANPRILWLAKTFTPALLDGASLVYSAEKELNASVSAAAQARGIPVNAVDEAEISTFIVPSIVDRDPVVIAIGTEGTAPVLAMGIRARIDALLPHDLGKLATHAASLRTYIASVIPQGNRRRAFWHGFFFGPVRDAVLTGDDATVSVLIDAAVSDGSKFAIGRVSLVGAGPGDPELLTLKAHRKIQEADVIVYDRLVSPAVLEMARRDAVRIAVGKPSNQVEIKDILIREARKGLNVVRLNGNESYASGRPAAEQTALDLAGIAVEIVPGVAVTETSAEIFPFPLREDIRDAILKAAS